MTINLRECIEDVETLITEKEAEKLFEAAGFKRLTYKQRQVVFDRKSNVGLFLGTYLKQN